MAKALCNKGFPLYDDIAELVNGMLASGAYSCRGGKKTLQVPSTPNAATSVLTAYEPVINPDLLAISLEEGDDSDLKIDGNVNVSKKSFHKHEMESFISTVSSTVIHTSRCSNKSSRMMKWQTNKQAKGNQFGSDLQGLRIQEMKSAKLVGCQQCRR